MHCTLTLLRGDPAAEVRRGAAFMLSRLLKSVGACAPTFPLRTVIFRLNSLPCHPHLLPPGEECFAILQHGMTKILRDLRAAEAQESDSVAQQHIASARYQLEHAVKLYITAPARKIHPDFYKG